VTKDEFVRFNTFLKSIDDLELALGMYTAAGASVSRGVFYRPPRDVLSRQPLTTALADELRRACKAVAHVDLDDNIVDIVFTIFDIDGECECERVCRPALIVPRPESGDGQLSHREFVAIMKQRARRGISDSVRSRLRC
jgi:hypothetical protein